MAQQPEKENRRFEELDALRGLASLMVVLFHFTMGWPQANLGFKLGTVGVDLFFIISGFVIFMSLQKIQSGTEFVINRVTRLYPTYWTCVAFTFFLLYFFSYPINGIPAPTLQDFLINLTMFQYYFKVDGIDGPYWTMIIEMVFYLAILSLFKMKILRHFRSIFFGLSLLGLVFIRLFSNNSVVQEMLFLFPLFHFLPLFFAGMLFYKIYTDENKKQTDYGLLVYCFTVQILLFHFVGHSKDYIFLWHYAVMLVLIFTTFILFINQKLKFIVNAATLYLGKISFALYLIHQAISVHFIIPYLTKKLGFNFWIGATIALITVILIATIITFCIEIPLGKKLKKELKHRFLK